MAHVCDSTGQYATRLRHSAGPERARARLTAHREDSRLCRQLRRYLAARQHEGVYDRPGAFQAFIEGGGNPALYEATRARLASAYAEPGVRAVLDIGCGDGRAVIPAARQAAALSRIDLLEPSSALLAEAESDAVSYGLPTLAHNATLTEFLDSHPESHGSDWDLAQATFALSAVPPAEQRRALAEFDGGGGLVAQGFLMPVLVGQVEPGGVRSTWEQPASQWRAQFCEAGWRDVCVESLAEFWWAPAMVVTASST